MGTLIYRSEYSYRKSSVLLVGLALVSVAGFALAELGYGAVIKPLQGAEWVGAVFVGCILSSLLACGIYFATAYLRSQRLELIISTAGVQYGNKRCDWQDIRWIAGACSRGRYQLVFGRHGMRPDQHLVSDHGLSAPEYEELITNLKQAISPSFPTVTIG